MTDFYAADTMYLVYGPDLTMLFAREAELPDLLREHGPERLRFQVQTGQGELEALAVATRLVGKDDKFKYYRTELTGAVSGKVADIGWDV